jgi:hypothetical protein
MKWVILRVCAIYNLNIFIHTHQICASVIDFPVVNFFSRPRILFNAALAHLFCVLSFWQVLSANTFQHIHMLQMAMPVHPQSQLGVNIRHAVGCPRDRSIVGLLGLHTTPPSLRSPGKSVPPAHLPCWRPCQCIRKLFALHDVGSTVEMELKRDANFTPGDSENSSPLTRFKSSSNCNDFSPTDIGQTSVSDSSRVMRRSGNHLYRGQPDARARRTGPWEAGLSAAGAARRSRSTVGGRPRAAAAQGAEGRGVVALKGHLPTLHLSVGGPKLQ